jgi:PAS domain S-box-containing protein
MRPSQTGPAERPYADLQPSEAKFAGILAIAADAIVSVDESLRIIHFNRGAEEIFGHTAAEAIGQHLNMLIPKRYWAVHSAHMRTFTMSPDTARRMGERREIFGARKDGREFPAEASISKLTLADGSAVFTAVLRDVTDRKRAEEDERFLAESGARLARSIDYEEVLQAIANLPVPRLADATILDVLEGDLVRQVAGTTQHDAARPEVGRAVIALRIGDIALGALTLISTRPDRPLGDDIRALAAKYAFSAALSLQNARLYSETQRAKLARDDVLNVVSHDLRNPISAIAMCARVLRNAPPADEAGRAELLDTITRSTEWVNRLIQDLVDVSNIERGQLSLDRRVEEIGTLVTSAIGMFDVEAGDDRITLVADVEAGLPAIEVDGARVVQLLGNLVRNAVKFTPSDGTIVIGARRGGDGVILFVRDTGPGIPPELHQRIFDRYWHDPRGARKRGSGLGLSIAKGIAQAHGGRIWVESEVGKGATFFVTLPSA